MSIKTKLLSLIIASLVIGTILILVVANNQLTLIVNENQDILYSERIETIIGILQVYDDRLHTTGQVEAYIDGFKKSAIKTLRKSYYHQKDQIIFPFIIDHDGNMVMRPQFSANAPRLAKPAEIKSILQIDLEKSGSFEFENRWYIYRHFSAWDWTVIYTIPIESKSANVRSFINTLVSIMIGITMFTILAIWFAVTRITRPITKLVMRSSTIANGDFSSEIEVIDSSEIGQLTRAFNRMAVAINKKILDLHREVDARKQVENDLLKNQYYLSKAQEIGAIGTWELDILHNILIWTEENYKIFGVPYGTEMNYESFLDRVHPDDRDYFNEKWRAGLNKVPYDIEHRIIINDKVKWVREKADIEFDLDGKPLKAIGFTQDITSFKLAEEQIKASLVEKETLLHEIHHRVKNNMQIIASLLKLQLNRKKTHVDAILKENISRVHAMAAIHDSLHQSEKLTEIGFKEYLQKLTQMLLQTYSISPAKVVFSFDCEDRKLGFDIANPLGLVLNELISNSLKYAFPDDRNGSINIRSNILEGENYELSIYDDGIGMPDGFDWKKTDSLGLKLVQNLVENQLGGSIILDGTKGTKFTIKFNLESNYK
ncbi:HAMP domain-containing protein [bacterium]|nr:HAMP domain-containing protein [bacterium]